MRLVTVTIFLLAFSTSTASSQTSNTAREVVAITNVRVVHTHEKRVVEDATVLLREGKIAWVGKAEEAQLPGEGKVIDGTGKYLIPGLVDGHIHFFQSGGLYTRPDALDLRSRVPYDEELDSIRANFRDVFRRYLRCGITTVADAGGPMWNFDVRALARSMRVAPRVFLTGPLIASYQPDALTTDDPPIIKVTSPEEARALVRREVEKQPDFIKVWYVVSEKLGLDVEQFRPTCEAIVDESRKAGLPVWAHATQLETARAAVEAGADVLVHDITDEEVDKQFLELARERGVILVPTLWVFQSYALVFAGQFTPTKEELAFADPRVLGSLFDIRGLDESALPERAKALQGKSGLDIPNPVALANVHALHDGGVRIAAGTDAGNIGVLHGPSLFRELELMHEAGMDAHDVLISATLQGAALVGREQQQGSIQAGKAADLVLLNSNPLDNLENCADISLVFKDGYVFDPDTLLPRTPVHLAQMQLNAYNARNLDAFLEPYAEDVEVYTFPSTLQYTGKQHMRELYGEFFSEAEALHCRLVGRISYQNTVIDREYVTGIPGRDNIEAVAIYEMADGFIQKVWFIQ
ncbi:amidohydrolase family protein [bacterium]|nr:amidohydrolase family protein [bacterium]